MSEYAEAAIAPPKTEPLPSPNDETASGNTERSGFSSVPTYGPSSVMQSIQTGARQELLASKAILPPNEFDKLLHEVAEKAKSCEAECSSVQSETKRRLWNGEPRRFDAAKLFGSEENGETGGTKTAQEKPKAPDDSRPSETRTSRRFASGRNYVPAERTISSTESFESMPARQWVALDAAESCTVLKTRRGSLIVRTGGEKIRVGPSEADEAFAFCSLACNIGQSDLIRHMQPILRADRANGGSGVLDAAWSRKWALTLLKRIVTTFGIEGVNDSQDPDEYAASVRTQTTRAGNSFAERGRENGLIRKDGTFDARRFAERITNRAGDRSSTAEAESPIFASQKSI